MFRLVLPATLLALASAHDVKEPINTALGVPGYPDCYRCPHASRFPRAHTKTYIFSIVIVPGFHRPKELGAPRDVESAAMELVCEQKGSADTIKVGRLHTGAPPLPAISE